MTKMAPDSAKRPSSRPDLAVIQQLVRVESLALTGVELVATTTLLLWLAHALGADLPAALLGMRLPTAIALLLLCRSLRRSDRPAATRGHRLTVASLGLVALMALCSLLGHLLLLPGVAASTPGLGDLIPWPTALALLFCVTSTLGVRVVRLPWTLLVDAAMVALAGMVLMLMSSFLFGTTGLFGAVSPLPTAPQTILCLMLVAFVSTARRMQTGFHAVLVGVGIGSRIARLVLPYAIALPFLLVLVRTWAAREGLISEAYATGISVSLQVLLFLGIVIWMGFRINVLESELRHMSLADELTGIHNRRGFMMLAEQALRVAHRERLPALLFFFDLDGLKRINDTLGHDIGSDFLRRVAGVLKASFREGDVVARIGGDEFAVLAVDHDLSAEQTLSRVQARAAMVAARERLPYEIAFSSGWTSVDFNDAEALSAALQRADARMYAAKRARRAAPSGS